MWEHKNKCFALKKYQKKFKTWNLCLMKFKLKYFYRLAPIFYAPLSNSKRITLVLVIRNLPSLSWLGAKGIWSKFQILSVCQNDIFFYLCFYSYTHPPYPRCLSSWTLCSTELLQCSSSRGSYCNMLPILNQHLSWINKITHKTPEPEVQIYWISRTFLLHCGLVWNRIKQQKCSKLWLVTNPELPKGTV